MLRFFQFDHVSFQVGAAFTAVEPVDDFTEATVVVRLLDPWTKERSEVQQFCGSSHVTTQIHLFSTNSHVQNLLLI